MKLFIYILLMAGLLFSQPISALEENLMDVNVVRYSPQHVEPGQNFDIWILKIVSPEKINQSSQAKSEEYDFSSGRYKLSLGMITTTMLLGFYIYEQGDIEKTLKILGDKDVKTIENIAGVKLVSPKNTIGATIIAGIYPASRAAKLDPIEALRAE